MRATIGAILVVAASILLAGGIIAEQLRASTPQFGGVGGSPGFIMGGIVGIFGLIHLAQGLKHDPKNF